MGSAITMEWLRIRGDCMKQGKLLMLGVLAATMAACAPKSSNNNEGTINDLTQSQSNGIIGGVDVPAGNQITRSIVAVYDAAQGALCTGSLLENNIVLTAAHCVSDNPSDMFVMFDTKLSGESEHRQVDKAAVTPYWASNQMNDKNTGDLGLVHFTGDIPVGYAPATFLSNAKLLKKGTTVILAGYGISDGVSGDGAGTLRATNVKIADAKFSSTEVELDQTKGTGACHGDSGGPAYIYSKGQYLLWGVTSRGVNDPNNDCTRYSAYTNVLVYMSWIQETAAKLTSSVRSLAQAQ